MDFETKMYYDRAHTLYRRADDLRYIRNAASNQATFLNTVSSEGFTESLRQHVQTIPGIIDLFTNAPVPSVESVASVIKPELSTGLCDTALRTAIVADWVHSTADNLSEFIQVTDSHLDGLQLRLKKNIELFTDEDTVINYDALVYGEDVDTQRDHIEHVTQIVDLLGPLNVKPSSDIDSLDSYQAGNRTLLHLGSRLTDVSGMIGNGTDYGSAGEGGFFCAEILVKTRASDLGYDAQSTVSLMQDTLNLLRSVRCIQQTSDEYIAGIRSVGADMEDRQATGGESESVEVFGASLTCLANYVTLLVCVHDCAVHLVLNLMYIGDEMLKPVARID